MLLYIKCNNLQSSCNLTRTDSDKVPVASHAGNAAKDVTRAAKDVTRAVKIAGDGKEGTQATLLWILITFIYKIYMYMDTCLLTTHAFNNLHSNMCTSSYITVFINCYPTAKPHGFQQLLLVTPDPMLVLKLRQSALAKQHES